MGYQYPKGSQCPMGCPVVLVAVPPRYLIKSIAIKSISSKPLRKQIPIRNGKNPRKPRGLAWVLNPPSIIPENEQGRES